MLRPSTNISANWVRFPTTKERKQTNLGYGHGYDSKF